MIPVSLTLQGIHSYQEQQTIDFRGLTHSQLFGIFGSVGSGKSTILEAIMLALYGRSERLEKEKGIGYDVMNLRSQQLYIDFMFEVGANQQLYRYTVTAKRSQKNFHNVGALQNSAYQWQNGEWIPLAHASAESVLGLSYDHFKRTVIIPQGKFQEFLQLKDKDRTEMMQDLFNLHRFDLSNNVKTLQSQANNQLQQIEGALAGYQEVSADALVDAWEALHTQLTDIDHHKQKYRKQAAEYQRLQQLKADHEQYEKAKTVFQELNEQKPAYDQLAETLRQVQQCRFYFQDRLERLQTNEQSIENNQGTLNATQTSLSQAEEAYQATNQKLQELQSQHRDQASLQQAITDLQTIRSIIGFKAQLQEKKQSLEQARETLKAAEKAFRQQEAQWQKARRRSQEQYQQLPDQSTLSAVKAWYTQQQSLIGRRDQAYQEASQKEAQIQGLKSQRQALVHQQQLDQLNPEFPNYTMKALRPALEALRTQYQTQQETLDEEIRVLQTQQALEAFGGDLHEGKPCPVCGSSKHPDPIKPGDTTKQVEQKQQQKQEYRQWQEAIARTLEGLEGLRQQYGQLRQEYDRQQQLLAEARQHLEVHQQNFIWPNYQPFTEQQVDEAQRQARAQQEQLQYLEKLRNQEEQAKEEARQSKDGADKAVQDLSHEVSTLEERIQSYHRQLQRLPYAEYASDEAPDLSALGEQWQQDYQQMQTLQNALDQQKPEIDKQRQKRDQLQATVEEQQRQWQALQDELTHLLAQSEFDNLGQVQRLLDDYAYEDLEARQQEISRFQQQHQAQKESLAELEKRLAQTEAFDEETFNAAKTACEKAEQALQDVRRSMAIQQQAIQRQQQQLIHKQKLESQKRVLQDRLANLQTLERLFRGRGFVKYISTVFMQELCRSANERFKRLTNNQLQLEATDNASLQIRDLLNDGHPRSVKTLSGGQTFQVSLSLALALAEQIQQLTGSPQNFFFLDEGFGSLDPESLRLVFDTLNRLRHENRIVGIISHVDELKEGLETALTVKNHPERGSLISSEGL